MIDAKELLSMVTKDVVIEIMAENGSKLHSVSIDRKSNQECLWFTTICHGGDSHKLCFFTKTKDFFCYTNCGRMPFFNCIAKILQMREQDFFQVLLYVAKKVGYKTDKSSIDEYREGFGNKELAKNIDELKKEFRETHPDIDDYQTEKNRKIVNINKFYDPLVLNYFDKNVFYQGWIDEGISIRSMQKFGIEWYELEKHIIIPHVNEYGKLVGIRRRSLKKEDAQYKYMPEKINEIYYDHPLGLNLYGLYQNKDEIKKTKTVIIAEGEKSVLLSDTYSDGHGITVATCGFNISEWQIRKLQSLGVNRFYLAFDKDYEFNFAVAKKLYINDEKEWTGYKNYSEKIENLEKRLSCVGQVYLINDKNNLLKRKDSPFDQGKDVFNELFRTADIYIPDDD